MENNTLVLDTFECSDESLKSRDNVNISAHYCNAVHDGIACWPPTPPGVNIAQHCPPLPGLTWKCLCLGNAVKVDHGTTLTKVLL